MHRGLGPVGTGATLRYCARPPFATERLQQRDAEHLIYEAAKPGPGGRGPQILTPLQLIDRLAALVPPPRVHRHRYYGVLAPNSPLRSAVTALAAPAATLAPAPRHPPPNRPTAPPPATRGRCCSRIYAVFPLHCPLCDAEMRIIALITDPPTVRDILIHLGEPITPPTIAPARGPPLWAAAARLDSIPSEDPSIQPPPAYEFDQRIAW